MARDAVDEPAVGRPRSSTRDRRTTEVPERAPDHGPDDLTDDPPLGRMALLLIGLVIAPISAWCWVADMNARARVDAANGVATSTASHEIPLPDVALVWPGLTILGLTLLAIGLTAVLPQSEDEPPS